MKIKLLFIILFLSFNLHSQKSVYDSLKVELNIFKKNVKIDKSDLSIYELLNNFYHENLQTNKGLSNSTLKTYREFSESDSLKNKSILFLFNKYQYHISKTATIGKNPDPEFQIAVMKLLAGECVEIFDSIPAIVLIYMGEALMSNQLNEKALEHFEISYKFYPDSIPIMIYLVLLDEKKHSKVKKKLLRKHKKHWMVQKMI